MNNKKGGVGAKILLVLILMIASAIGGAYGYRVLDGKMAIRDASKDIEAVRISDYDTVEAATVENLVETAKKDLETAATRKEVYEIMQDFNTEVAKVQTKTQKELEEARRAAEEAKNNSNNNYNNNNSNGNYGNEYDDYNSNTDNYNSDNNNNVNSDSNSSDAITNNDGSSGRSNSILGSLLGGKDDDN